MKFRAIPTVLTDGLSQVKGENFINWRSVGSVVQAIKVHSTRDVDEVVLLDVNATKENRVISVGLVALVAPILRVPLAVGGGIQSTANVKALLEAGADKVVIGSECFRRPAIVSECATVFGSQAIVCSVDYDPSAEGIGAGPDRLNSIFEAVEFARSLEELGAGEILLQDVSRDGTQIGMNFDLLELASRTLNIPVIGSSGAGSYEDFFNAFRAGASAVAAGAIFQFTEITPSTVRSYLRERGVPVRI